MVPMESQADRSLPVTDFKAIIEALCVHAAADFMAARSRLERLRRDGPEVNDGEG
jgi:hypothetical protein